MQEPKSQKQGNDETRSAHDFWPEVHLSGNSRIDGKNSPKDFKWWQRLQERVNELRWSKADLSRRSGVAYDSVNKYLRGIVDKPRGDILDQLARAVGRDSRWILFGDNIKASRYVTDNLVTRRLFPFHGRYAKSHILNWDDLPKYSDLTYGLEQYSALKQTILRHVSTCKSFCVKVPDESMLPEFQPSGLLMFEVDAVCQTDDYVIACTKDSDDVIFRRLQITTPDVATDDIIGVLKAASSVFPDIPIGRQNPARIIGKMVAYLEPESV